MEPGAAIRQKVQELSQAMKAEGLWKRSEPDWVGNYELSETMGTADFIEWLQFVYLPNKMQGNKNIAGNIAPQAVRFFGDDVKRGRLLQLLVELDSLS